MDECAVEPRPVINPLDALGECERIARQALRDLHAGHATTGSSALQKIERWAQDAQRWAPVSAVAGGTIAS